MYTAPMRNERLNSSTTLAHVGVQLQAAFRRVRDELDIGSDAELARRLGFPSTYVHWIGLTRPWPMDEACKLAAAGNCHLDELLRIGGEDPGGIA